MLDPMFNGFLFFMLAVWVAGMLNSKFMKRFTGSLIRHGGMLAPSIAWVVFLAFCVSIIIWFSGFNGIHDIPTAVNAGVVDAVNSGNPYVDKVIPRFATQNGTGTNMDLGTYNYLPWDLLVYAGMHQMLGFLGFPVWFVVSNLLFWALAFGVFYEFMNTKLRGYIPFVSTCALFYSFDNAALTTLLMVGAVYALKKLRRDQAGYVALFLMAFAALTKVYAAIPFLVLFMWLLEEGRRENRTGEPLRLLGTGAACVLIGVLLMLPFGFWNVLDSAVFFHLSSATRVGTSVGGTVLAEIADSSPYFVYVEVSAIAASIVASLKLKNLNDRMMLVSIVFCLVSVRSSLSLLTVPGLFLGLRIREWMDAARPRQAKDGGLST